MGLFVVCLTVRAEKSHGPNGDLNPGPPAPKAGIIPLDHLANVYEQLLFMESLNRRKRRSKKSLFGSGGIRTHASEETGALNQRLRPLGHATCLSSHALSVFLKSFYSCALITINNNTTFFFFSSYQRWWPRNVVSIRSSQPVSLSKTTKLIIA